MVTILEGFMLDAICNRVFRCSKQRVKSSFVVVHGSEDEIFVFTIFSDIANYRKEICIAKYNRRGDVVMQCHRHHVVTIFF